MEMDPLRLSFSWHLSIILSEAFLLLLSFPTSVTSVQSNMAPSSLPYIYIYMNLRHYPLSFFLFHLHTISFLQCSHLTFFLSLATLCLSLSLSLSLSLVSSLMLTHFLTPAHSLSLPLPLPLSGSYTTLLRVRTGTQASHFKTQGKSFRGRESGRRRRTRRRRRP